MKNKVPKYNELIQPTFTALKKLGGSGSNKEILEQVIADLNLDDKITDIPHVSKQTSYQSELEYRLAWARTYLAKSCIIESSSRAVWAICPAYTNVEALTEKDVIKIVKNAHKNSTNNKKVDTPQDNDSTNDDIEFPEEEKPWKVRLAETLHQMNPYAFERLSQRLLRECGFSKVTVTKKSNDGGIDGKGELKINGIVTFKIAFQCKRYKNSVGSKEIRDFRGSLTTDIEKAVFITTGTFTRSAKEEAAVPGKLNIDLIDGEELITKIAELQLGVKEVKTYEIDENFFKNI